MAYGEVQAVLYDDASYGKGEEEEEIKTFGAKTYGIIQLVMGLVLLGCALPILFDMENYNSIRSPLTESGSPLSVDLTLPLFQLASSFLLVVSGLFSLQGFYRDSQTVVLLGVFLSVVASIFSLFISFTLRNSLSQLFIKLQGNPVTDDSFTDSQVSALDFTSAIFNECCLSQYDSVGYNFGGFTGNLTRTDSNGNVQVVDFNQRRVRTCGTTIEETCPGEGEPDGPMFPKIVTTLLDTLGSDKLTNLLCSCVGNEQRYDEIVQIFKRDDSCNAFRKIIINDVDSRVIPVVNRNYRELVIGLGLQVPELKERLPINRFALVGKILPPNQLYQEPSEDIGWSCGLGYAKAVALAMYFYISDLTRPILVAGATVACISLVSSVFLLGMWYTGVTNTFDMDQEDEYAEHEINNAAARKKKSLFRTVKSRPRNKLYKVMSRKRSLGFNWKKKQMKNLSGNVSSVEPMPVSTLGRDGADNYIESINGDDFSVSKTQERRTKKALHIPNINEDVDF